MTINMLIELMNNNKTKLLKAEQIQAFLKKELEVKEYLSIKQKKELVNSIVNECVLFEDGIYKFDEIDKYICFTMRTIAAYTNIELSDDIEVDYDMLCEAKLLNPVVETFGGEYENVKVLLQMRCDYILSGNNIEAQVGKFLTELFDKMNGLVDVATNKVESFKISDLPINKETISALMGLINK